MSEIQKIGLLGGTFDPVHLGHLIIAEAVLNEMRLDKIYFIPAHKHALKSNNKISSPNIRLEMLQIALKDFSHYSVSDIELKSDKVSFTIYTLNKICDYENLSNAELFYIIGFDNLTELHLWKDYERILEVAQLVVVSRPGNYDKKLIKKYENKLIVAETPKIDISSTIIRKLIKENRHWKSLVTHSVYQYIITHNLYK